MSVAVQILTAARPGYPRKVESDATRIVRCMWMIRVGETSTGFTFEDYRRRFGTEMSSFRRDLRACRNAGVRIAWNRGSYFTIAFDKDMAC